MAIDTSFEHMLKIGQTGEDIISCWLRSRQWSVLPVYPVVEDAHKGPRLYTAYQNEHKELIAPDILAMKGQCIQWVEAKRKSRFAWYEIYGKWQTGIDLRHYEHYLRVSEATHLPVWLFFLHVDSVPSAMDIKRNSPAECPVGLFGGEIKYLESKISQKDKYQKNGRDYPMVYWQHEHLKEITTLKEVIDAALHVRYGL
jgi:hypothetical protein